MISQIVSRTAIDGQNRPRREGPYLKSATRTEPSRESTLAVTSWP